jgi:Raf kinase inhibitor-like YbhB/YbcL family protein
LEVFYVKLKSSDFEDGGNIPSEFTCDGRDVSPQLSWEAVPAGTESFALSVADPDAPRGTFIHWLVYDIPKDVNNIGRGSLPKEAVEVENDFGRRRYGGPCPPSGTHRYIFTLCALNSKHLEGVNKYNYFSKVEEHTLNKTQLTGLYKRR